MLLACWSAKGGSGTTVVVATLARMLSTAGTAVLVADLAGDVPAVLGAADPPGAGLADWLAADTDVPVDALRRIEADLGGGLSLLARGTGDLAAARGEALLAALAAEARPVIVDCGTDPTGVALTVAAAAHRSILVIRPCYLALRRAMAMPFRPSEVVLVVEPGRALGRADIEDVLGVPVRAELALDPAVARAVDAGLLGTRLPRSLERGLRRAA